MGLEISGLAGLVALALPLAALATVVLLAARDMGRRRAARREETRRPVTPDRDQPRRDAPALLGEGLGAGERRTSAGSPTVSSPLPHGGRESRGSVQLDNALSPDRLLDARLDAARSFVASGNAVEAANALRACLWDAGHQGRADIQAQARVELGDLCLAAGDPITACEHWQIARGYFSGLKNAREVAGIDARMRKNGCPTDWVLNDF